jgi:CRP-like cAMP-binding protein
MRNELMKHDEFDLLTNGPTINPTDLLEPGNVDIARLEGGGSCGELCLIDGKNRMATVKCLKRTHFLILNKKLYNQALQEIK